MPVTVYRCQAFIESFLGIFAHYNPVISRVPVLTFLFRHCGSFSIPVFVISNFLNQKIHLIQKFCLIFSHMTYCKGMTEKG